MIFSKFSAEQENKPATIDDILKQIGETPFHIINMDIYTIVNFSHGNFLVVGSCRIGDHTVDFIGAPDSKSVIRVGEKQYSFGIRQARGGAPIFPSEQYTHLNELVTQLALVHVLKAVPDFPDATVYRLGHREPTSTIDLQLLDKIK